MTKILLLGKNGQLGWELERCLQPQGEVTALDFPEIDIADGGSIKEVVARYTPNIIFNATAYTAVDKAESQVELAEAINGTGTGILAEEARRIGALLVHYSTDYVFDGSRGASYREDDQPSPVNVYGQTKLQGEQAVQQAGALFLIIRTSWVYSLRRDNFVTKVMEWARLQKNLRIVDDQVSSPTWARLLAECSAQVIAQGRGDPLGYLADKGGVYHLTGGGYCSRYEWVVEIMRHTGQMNLNDIQPAKSDEFLNPARRPLFSVLDCSLFMKTFHMEVPDWRTTLELAINSRV